MGFFRNISLDVHAQAISKSFEAMRKEYYSCIVANGRSAKEAEFPSAKTALAGEADLCMKGVQWLIAIGFVRQMNYVRNDEDANVLSGQIMQHGWIKERDAVSQYVLQFKDLAHSPELVARMAYEIVEYILGEDGSAWQSFVLMNVASRTLAPFPPTTRYIIASEFRDTQTARQLEAEIEAISVAASGSLQP